MFYSLRSRSPQQIQQMQQEIARLQQMLQESGSRGNGNAAELEQWRKVIEQEKARADKAEMAIQEFQKHAQGMDKQMQQQNQQLQQLQQQSLGERFTNFVNNKLSTIPNDRKKRLILFFYKKSFSFFSFLFLLRFVDIW